MLLHRSLRSRSIHSLTAAFPISDGFLQSPSGFVRSSLRRFSNLRRVAPLRSPVSILPPTSRCFSYLRHASFVRTISPLCCPTPCTSEEPSASCFSGAQPSETINDLVPWAEILGFIKSSFNELEGPHHCWLNGFDGNRENINQDGTFLVLVNAYIGDSAVGDHERMLIFERVKLLQQRYPKLNVFGLQCGTSVATSAIQIQIVRTAMEEYVTFPILISDKDFMKVRNSACYFLFDSCTNRFIYHKLDVDFGTIIKAIEELNRSWKDDVVPFQTANSDRRKHHEVIKEPSICSSFRNLLLFYPGCVSVDEDGKRMFISDSNHHRIIVTDGNGKILDCIGSSPGFEDGDFESAKLLRPAGSFYHSTEDCLYFADSENHAIRRADMERRVLETVYPVSVQKNNGIWCWILDKLGMAREIATKHEDFNLESLTFPWHLMKLGDMDLLVVNRSFKMSWIMSLTTGEIKKVLRGTSSIIEICQNMIMEKMSLLKDIHENWLSQRPYHSLSLQNVPSAGLMSSLAKFENNTIFCDSAGHRVLKYDTESGRMSYIHFSLLGVLGLPYWMISPLERISNRGYLCNQWNEHLHHFSVLPGRCNIHVNVNIPEGMKLVAPLEKGCIWRQVRGSGSEVYESEVATNSEKVGVALQWYDELDNIAFSKPEVRSECQVEEHSVYESFQDENKVQFGCSLNFSPGTSEVVVSAVLYLKLKNAQELDLEQNLDARRILNLPELDSRFPEDDACIQLLSETCTNLQDVVFMKPLHLRIRFECLDHPTAVTNKETILTDSSLEVNVSLN